MGTMHTWYVQVHTLAKSVQGVGWMYKIKISFRNHLKRLAWLTNDCLFGRYDDAYTSLDIQTELTITG